MSNYILVLVSSSGSLLLDLVCLIVGHVTFEMTAQLATAGQFKSVKRELTCGTNDSGQTPGQFDTAAN